MQILEIVYHRNGVSGTGFYAILFSEEGRRMVGTVFPEASSVAVYDVDKLDAGDVGFGSNSWRGDNYETALRDAIREDEIARYGYPSFGT